MNRKSDEESTAAYLLEEILTEEVINSNKKTLTGEACKEKRIEGVIIINRVWLIPKTAKKPADGRYKVNKKQDGVD